MALKHVVLGLLADRPDHGYALKHRISPGLPRERLINDGVLYPLLARLEDEGLLSSSEREARGRPRRVYTATAAGRREFRRWLASAEDEGEPPGYQLYVDHPLLKLLFASELSADQVQGKLARQRERSREWLSALDALRDATPPGEETEMGRALYELEAAAHRERLAVLDRLRDRGAASADRGARPGRSG
jgi:DNA-binding PadR family transcriptional regulator